MLSDEVFYTTFRDWVIGLEKGKKEEDKVGSDQKSNNDNEQKKYNKNENEEQQQKTRRLLFLQHQVGLIPAKTRDFYCNLMRSYPTSPVFLLLGLGSLGTNIARYSAVRRINAHITNVIRTGCFYKFMAPSRSGKGIVMGLISNLGGHVEDIRKASYDRWLAQEQSSVANSNTEALTKIRLQCSIKRPSRVFLTGRNVLKTQATAAANGGCGLIAVNTIKTGKASYTDSSGSYSRLLDFYNPELGAISFRNADFIPRIDKCRIQMIAAGVKQDWVAFLEKTGSESGSGLHARIIPVLYFDRSIVSMAYEKLPTYTFPLRGLKTLLEIMEMHFETCNSCDDDPPVRIQFSPSVLDKNYHATNSLLISEYKEEPVPNLRAIYRTLLDSTPPSTSELQKEGSGCGQLSVYLAQALAEFTPLISTGADRTFLRGLEDNLLRMASDFYWAFKLPSYLTVKGILTPSKEAQFGTDLKKILEDKVVTIPGDIVPQLLKLVTYVLKSTFSLNKLTTGSAVHPRELPSSSGSKKRFRIVMRLAEGCGRPKKRRFVVRKLDNALAEITTQSLEQQLAILRAQGITTAPTYQSVALEREFSEPAMQYLKENCEFRDEDLAQLLHANDLLLP